MSNYDIQLKDKVKRNIAGLGYSRLHGILIKFSIELRRLPKFLRANLKTTALCTNGMFPKLTQRPKPKNCEEVHRILARLGLSPYILNSSR